MNKKIIAIILSLMLILGTSCISFAESAYIVKSGDSLWKIAKNHGVTIKSLADANGITNVNYLRIGQKLIVPSGTVITVQETAVVTATDVVVTAKKKPVMITKEDSDPYGGADLYDNGGDNPNSRFYKNPDFYRLKSDDQLTIITGFKTFQQTNEWSCGVATAVMVLENFGIKAPTEIELAKMANAGVDLDVAGSEPGTANNWPEYGTSVDDLSKLFKQFSNLKILETSYMTYAQNELLEDLNPARNGNLPPSFSAMSLYTSENSDDSEEWVEDASDSYFVKWVKSYLTKNIPIMVQWCDWDGHWQAIIGYDNNGTEGIGDDVLIFADPYDTSDHWQDGYYYYPLERWFYMWKDTNVAPKPFQMQPYMIVGPAK